MLESSRGDEANRRCRRLEVSRYRRKDSIAILVWLGVCHILINPILRVEKLNSVRLATNFVNVDTSLHIIVEEEIGAGHFEKVFRDGLETGCGVGRKVGHVSHRGAGTVPSRMLTNSFVRCSCEAEIEHGLRIFFLLLLKEVAQWYFVDESYFDGLCVDVCTNGLVADIQDHSRDRVERGRCKDEEGDGQGEHDGCLGVPH